ncbi:hypothetical protein XANCAGTX0491_009185 [Xanthoria calcicola]
MAITTRARKKREEEAKALEEAEQKDPSPNPDIQRQVEDPNSNHSRSSPDSEPDEATPISRWHGIPLPQFYIPRWRIRAGVPTVVLKPINVDTRFVPTNDFSGSPDDVAIDTQSSHSVSEDSDAATSDSDHYADKNDIPIPIGPVRYDQIPPGQEDDLEDTPEQDDDVKFYENNDVYALAVEGLSSDPNVNDWEFEKWGESLTKFVRSPFGPRGFLGGGWQGVKPLGRGGFAMAALWERTNEDNDSVDSIVIKQIGKQKVRRKGAFQEERAWESTPPMEVELMRSMKNKNNTVQIRGYRRYVDMEVHRIYMEYCASGDLAGLIAQYRSRRQYMPEAFICHVFLHLARACQSLTEPGSPSYEPERYQDTCQNEIAHRDIKPRNVFIGDLDNGQDTTGIPYPEIKLGDFGIAIFTGVDDHENPERYRGTGTEGYKSLEMENFTSIDRFERAKEWPHIERAEDRFNRLNEAREGILSVHPYQILSWTNIWGVGAVMFDIMTLKPIKNYLWQTRDPNDEDYDDEVEQANVRTGIRNTPYDSTLTNLVQLCLRDIPNSRIKIPNLIARLEIFAGSKQDEWHNSNNGSDQRIPWHDFKSIPPGEWESSENQSAWRPPDSSFVMTPGEKQRWDANRPERLQRQKEMQAERNEIRRVRREMGEQGVEDDEVWPPPNTGERKRKRARVREGKDTETETETETERSGERKVRVGDNLGLFEWTL